MILLYLHSKHSCTEEALAYGDTTPGTDTESMRVAMFSEQKSLGVLSKVTIELVNWY